MKRKVIVRIIELVIVNLITLSRLLGAILLPFVYVYNGVSICAILTICLFATDAIDGFLARALKISTFFGSTMDAVCDKLLNFTSFIILGIEYNIMLAPFILETAIILTAYSTYRFGGNVQSTKTGKIKTVILDVCVILSFAILSLPTFNLNNIVSNYLISKTSNYISFFGCIITIACLFALLDYKNRNKTTRSNPKFTHVKYQKRIKKNFKELFHDIFDTEFYLANKNKPIMSVFYK